MQSPMRFKHPLLLTLLVLAVLNGCAQTQPTTPAQELISHSNLVIYRADLKRSSQSIRFTVSLDGKVIKRLQARQYIALTLAPGDYRLDSNLNSIPFTVSVSQASRQWIEATLKNSSGYQVSFSKTNAEQALTAIPSLINMDIAHR